MDEDWTREVALETIIGNQIARFERETGMTLGESVLRSYEKRFKDTRLPLKDRLDAALSLLDTDFKRGRKVLLDECMKTSNPALQARLALIIAYCIENDTRNFFFWMPVGNSIETLQNLSKMFENYIITRRFTQEKNQLECVRNAKLKVDAKLAEMGYHVPTAEEREKVRVLEMLERIRREKEIEDKRVLIRISRCMKERIARIRERIRA